MPFSDINKPNEIEDRNQAKRIEDLENLYELLPHTEPDVVEIHYDQFEGNVERTYNFLSKGMHHLGVNPLASEPRVVVQMPVGADPFTGAPMGMGHPGYYHHPQPRPQQNEEEMVVNNAQLPEEEKEMINKALRSEKRKVKKMKQAKKVGF